MYLLISIILITIAYDSTKRTSILSPISFYLWFILFDLILLKLASNINSEVFYKYSALPALNNTESTEFTFYVFFIIALISWVITRNIKINKQTISQEHKVYTKQKYEKVFFLLSGLVLLFSFILHAIEINLSLIWHHYGYLTLDNPKTAGIDSSFGRLLHFAYRYLGLFSFITALYALYRKNIIAHIAFLFLSIYPLLILFAQNSRWVPLYFVVGFIINVFLYGKIMKIQNIVLVILGIFSFLKVLIGRSYEVQGISSTTKIFSEILNTGIVNFLALFNNAIQGGQNFSHALQIDTNYSTLYKILSFSPLVSAVDGFDSIRADNLAKITPFAPLNAYAEAWHFGIIYFMIFVIFLIIMIRQMTLLYSKRINAISVISITLCYWCIFSVSQYPIRNSWRLIIFLTLLGVGINYYYKKYGKNKNNI